MKICLILLIFSSICCSDSLRMIVELSRHGSRAPNTFLDEDKKEDFFGQIWKLPSDSLTPVGLRQSYLAGVRLREEYSSFFPSTFNQTLVRAFTTPKQRTRLSLQAKLQGLFPPGTASTLTQPQVDRAVPPVSDVEQVNKIKESLGNQQVEQGVSHINIEEKRPADKHFGYEYICPDTLSLFKESQNSEIFKKTVDEMLNEHFEFLTKLSKITSKAFFYDYTQFWTFFDSFLAGYSQGFNYGSEVDTIKMYNLAIKYYHFHLKVKHLNKEVTKVAVSGFLREILGYFTKRIELDASNENFTVANPSSALYSCHDTCIYAVLDFFEFSQIDTVTLDPASILVFELHENSGKNSVKAKLNFQFEVLDLDFTEFKEKIEKDTYSTSELEGKCE